MLSRKQFFIKFNPFSIEIFNCFPGAMKETRVRSLSQEDPLEKEWPPTPVFLPGESHGWRSLVGYSPSGCEELDTTE